MIEGRMLNKQETKIFRYGAVAGVYYHLNDDAKVGVCYRWSEFDDDFVNFGFDNQTLICQSGNEILIG